MDRSNVAIVQYAPTYARIAENFDRHAAIIKEAAKGGAELVVFPELSLTGYFLRDLTHRMMIPAGSLEKELNSRCKTKKLPDVVLGFVEEGESYNPYNSFAYLEHTPRGYKLIHTHRKCFLPTYGMFEDARFFAPGRSLGVFETKFGKIGLLLCEDAWHPMSFYVEALKGAEIIIVGSASPARGISGPKPYNLEYWDRLNSSAAATWATYIIYASRTGVEDSVVFSGGSSVFSPGGDKLVALPEVMVAQAGYEMAFVDIEKNELRRARETTPLLRDENLSLFSEEIANLKSNYYKKNGHKK